MCCCSSFSLTLVEDRQENHELVFKNPYHVPIMLLGKFFIQISFQVSFPVGLDPQEITESWRRLYYPLSILHRSLLMSGEEDIRSSWCDMLVKERLHKRLLVQNALKSALPSSDS